MRFDDSLATVLAADVSTAYGAQSAWRQLVDLIGRRRSEATPAAMLQLAELRGKVSQDIRAASARALAFADPPEPLVRFFADDHFVVAAPVLRAAQLPGASWVAMLPALSPQTRSVLRHRRDLSTDVVQALNAFGAFDFVLGDSGAASGEARELADEPLADLASNDPLPAVAPTATMPEPDEAPPGASDIARLVARIDAFRQRRVEDPLQPVARTIGDARPTQFVFETDERGVVRWVDGIARGQIVGLSLDLAASPDGTRVDGIAAGAFRRRAAFADARLVVEGEADAAGQWRIAATPMFDDRSGRFTGYRGAARRPRIDEDPERMAAERAASIDSLRQLVHELRTPANAILGFAEMIETQLMGKVAEPYRVQAAAIRDQASTLLGAIEDLDTAARLDARALDLAQGQTSLKPLLARIVRDLAPLAQLRGCNVQLDPFIADLRVRGDERAVDRLIGRLLAAVVATGSAGERLDIYGYHEDEAIIAITIERPAALAGFDEAALFAIDADPPAPGGPLLGTGFALRLARNLAAELGGDLILGVERLTLRLPAVVDQGVEQASIN